MRRILPFGALIAAFALTLSGITALAQEASPDAAASPAASPDLAASPDAAASPGGAVASPDAAASPDTGTTAPGEEAAHPAHIHVGSCPEVGDVAYPLSNVSSELLVDGEPGAGEEVGTMADPAAEVEVSVTTVQAALSDITGAEHAINVHLSDDEIETYIACGNVAGSLILESGLAIRLQEQNDSGHSGIAWLAQAEEGSTAVYIFLVQDDGATGAAAEEPQASPAADQPVASPAAEGPAASPAAEEPAASPAVAESPAA